MTTATESDGPEMTEPALNRAPSPFAATVAKQIRIQLATADRTAAELATELDMHPNTMSRRMLGHSDWSLTELLAVAKFFRVPLSTIAPDSLLDEVLDPTENEEATS